MSCYISLSPNRLDHPISYGTSFDDKRPYLQQHHQQQKKGFEGKMPNYKPRELSTKATKSWSTLAYFEDPNSSGYNIPFGLKDSPIHQAYLMKDRSIK